MFKFPHTADRTNFHLTMISRHVRMAETAAMASFLVGALACGSDAPAYGPLDHLLASPSGRFVQVSSFDTTGGNADRLEIDGTPGRPFNDLLRHVYCVLDFDRREIGFPRATPQSPELTDLIMRMLSP